jgi:hypothetical protein
MDLAIEMKRDDLKKLIQTGLRVLHSHASGATLISLVLRQASKSARS